MLISGSRQNGFQEVQDRDEYTIQAKRHQGELAAREPMLLNEFVSGAKTGNLFHYLLEHSDFSQTDPRTLQPLCQKALKLFGMDLGLADVAAKALAEILSFDLTGQGLSLSLVPTQDRIHEMEFLMPFGLDAAGVNPSDLARIFERHASIPGYPALLERLEFSWVRGFVKGFADLVFLYQGRWYLVDYKTNHLGDFAEDYEPSRLAQAMAEGHYYLQYHLYLTALNAHLEASLLRFDYERDFGGVFYLFLRGMGQGKAGQSGVFFDRPGVEMIRAFSQLLMRRDAKA